MRLVSSLVAVRKSLSFYVSKPRLNVYAVVTFTFIDKFLREPVLMAEPTVSMSWLWCRRSSTRSSDAHELAEGDEKKKRDSRRSGFLNLIKSRSRSERPPTVLMTEELSSPKGPIRSPPVDTARKEIKAAEHNGAPERTEEMKTPEPLEEGPPEETGRVERSESRSSPQASRRYVQMMGSGMLAEMKAKQERRAASAQKVRKGQEIQKNSLLVR